MASMSMDQKTLYDDWELKEQDFWTILEKNRSKNITYCIYMLFKARFLFLEGKKWNKVSYFVYGGDMDIFVKNCNPMLSISLRKQWLKDTKIMSRNALSQIILLGSIESKYSP